MIKGFEGFFNELEKSNLEEAIKIQRAKIDAIYAEYRKYSELKRLCPLSDPERLILTRKVNGIGLGLVSAENKLERLECELRQLKREMNNLELNYGYDCLYDPMRDFEKDGYLKGYKY